MFPQVNPLCRSSELFHLLLQTYLNACANHLSSISTLPTFRGAIKHLFLLAYSESSASVRSYQLNVSLFVIQRQQPTYLYNSLSFPSHSVSTRSSDSLVLSIPYVRSSLGKRAFSVISPRLWNSLHPDTRNSSVFTNIPFPAQNTPLQNCFPSLGSFPSPWTVYPDFDSCYSHFMPFRMTPSVRHRAIEVYYYCYYYYYFRTARKYHVAQLKAFDLSAYD